MPSEYKFFRNLSEEEEKEFRQWARDNYVLGEPMETSWHPVVIDECFSMLFNKKEKTHGVDSKEQS